MDERLISQEAAKDYREQLVGRRFKHFKGNYYVVDNIGVDSENSTCLVIYHSEADDSLVWVRPVDMFMSRVDKEKYPDVEQVWRFEEVPDFPELDKALYQNNGPYVEESIPVE